MKGSTKLLIAVIGAAFCWLVYFYPVKMFRLIIILLFFRELLLIMSWDDEEYNHLGSRKCSLSWVTYKTLKTIQELADEHLSD